MGRALAPRGLRLFLETAALDPVALARCLPAVEHLGADYKLPGTLAEGGAAAGAVAAGAASAECVGLAVAAGRSVDVKMVLTAAVADADFVAALDRLRPWLGSFQLVLQPVPPSLGVTVPCPADQVSRFARLAAEFDPLVLPQVHKLLGID